MLIAPGSTDVTTYALDVLPRLAQNDRLNARPGQAIFSRHTSACFARRDPRTNRKHISLGECRGQLASLGLALLGILIRGIVSSCAEKQMGRITASPVVAMVENTKSFSDRAAGQFPGDAMRAPAGMGMSTRTHGPVASIANRLCPRPAGIGAARAVYGCPETLLKWSGAVIGARIVARKEAAGHALDGSALSMVVFCDSSSLPATAMAKTIAMRPSRADFTNFGHQNLHLLVPQYNTISTWLSNAKEDVRCQ